MSATLDTKSHDCSYGILVATPAGVIVCDFTCIQMNVREYYRRLGSSSCRGSGVLSHGMGISSIFTERYLFSVHGSPFLLA